MFVYWGRRGALSRFSFEVGHAALAHTGIDATISVSRQNESFELFTEFGEALLPVDTFSSSAGALLQSWRIPIIRQRLVNHLRAHGTQVVVELMPHVWSSFIAPAMRMAGARYVPIIHDSEPHHGDYRSRSVKWLLDRILLEADLILTLSGTVAGRIEAAGIVPNTKVLPLFHPDLGYASPCPPEAPRPGEALRLLFLGRIMHYKGLPLFLDMVELLRQEGLLVECGVYGEGWLGASAGRLKTMGAEVVNRWLSDNEIGDVLKRYHAVVLSHIEASQSGVAAAAYGAAVPVIATPVGGLVEQVQDSITGVLAARADAAALADAARRLLLDEPLYRAIVENLRATANERSMSRFVEDCVSHALFAGS